MSKQNKRQPSPDAPESNAGDDFHLLWAARKALSMLWPGSPLKGIRLEGPLPREAYEVDPRGDNLLGIDLAEYFGGDDFLSSTKVVYSQLKYSTRQSRKRWTAVRLADGKNGGFKGSIIHRLSSVFKAYLNEFGRDTVLAKLRISLVSNRPCNPALERAVSSAKKILAVNLGPMLSVDLLRQVGNTKALELKRLKDGCDSLKTREFTDFLRVLDLSECGQLSRLDQDVALVKEIRSFGFLEADRLYEKLKIYLARRTMPESRQAGILMPEDIVPVFNIGRVEDIFPARPHFEDIENPVDRVQASDIAKQIQDAGQKPVCIMGQGGIGKTVLARSLETHLPEGGETIIFDCYGGGSYLDKSAVRHGYQRAVMEIANELASRTGSPLLLNRGLSSEDLLGELIRRLDLASRVVRDQSPDALVVLIIDAADNSISAANSFGEESFVTGLVTIGSSLPEGCRLVLTSRIHRVKDLQMPSDSVFCSIDPFTSGETSDNVRRYLQSASRNETDEFHSLSNGIPRVQHYALTNSSNSISKAIDLLRPGGITLDGLIDGQLKQAGLKLGDDRSYEKVCQAMLTLPRPIPVAYIAKLSGENKQAVTDFCNDIPSGLELHEDLVSFRDEDFETRLRDRFGSNDALKVQMADLLIGNSGSDNYAAAHLADALRVSGRKADLIKLVHDEKLPEAIKDPIERAEVFARRACLALEVLLEDSDHAELLKLIIVVAGAAKTDQAVEDLLLNHSDLAFRYGDPATVQRLYLNTKNGRVDWYGRTHLLCAANFSRHKKTLYQACDHLKHAEAYIEHLFSIPEQERHDKSIEVDDLVLGGEAYLRINGLGEAVAWFSRWKPRTTVFAAVVKLAHTLLLLEGDKAFALLDGGIRADGLVAVIDAVMDSGLRPPKSWVHRAISVWHRFSNSTNKADATLIRPVVSLCEAAVLEGVDQQVILELLNRFSPPALEHGSSISSAERSNSIDTFLRARSLQSVITGNSLLTSDLTLLPERLQAEPDISNTQEHGEWEKECGQFKKIYDFLLPAYLLRARVIVGGLTSEDFNKAAQGALHSNGWSWPPEGRGPKEISLKARVLADAGIRFCPDSPEIIKMITNRFLGYDRVNMAVAFAEKTALVPSLHGVTLEFINEVACQLSANPLPSTELVRYFVKCCQLAGHIDPELGRHYFDKAVEAASEIDEEAFGLLQLLAALTDRAVTDDSSLVENSLAKQFAEMTEDCHWRLEGWDRFPWEDCINAITRLSPAVAAAALGRWDQRGILSFTEKCLEYVNTCLSLGRLSPITAVSMTTLAPLGNERPMMTGLAGLSALKAREKGNKGDLDDSLAILLDHAIRLAPISDRKAQTGEIIEWAEANGLNSHPAISEAKALLESLSWREDASKTVSSLPPSLPPKQIETGITIEWSEIIGGNSLTGPEGIEAACRSLAELIEKGDPTWEQRMELPRDLLTHIREHVEPKDYLGHLNALTAVAPDLIKFDDLVSALKGILDQWKTHPLVLKWWREYLPTRLATYHFHEFFWIDSFASLRLKQLETEICINKGEMIEAIFQALPRHLREVSVRAVYSLAAELIQSLPDRSALDLLKWALPRFNSRIVREELVCREIDIEDIPTEGDGLNAAILWFLFGHPDKRIRWRAIHAARRLVRLGDSQILIELAKWLEEGQKHPFVMPETTFYWLAARQWFFLLLDRLSAEMPETLLALSDIIAKEAIDPETPHVLIMHFAKRAAMNLAKHESHPYDTEQVNAIHKCLTPIKPLKTFDIDDESPLGNGYQRASASRFNFNSTDTVPYWFEPAGEVFGVDRNEFCEMAEHWICDIWGFKSDVWDSDPVEKWQANDRDWFLRSNDHGSEPTIEVLKRYLESNAMFCVMAELIRSRPELATHWDRNPWEEWVERWDLAYKDSWRSDKRQKTPPDRMFWEWPERFESKRADKIDDDYFDRFVGLLESSRPGYLVTTANHSRFEHGDYESIDINSALVPVETSHSLVHALAHCQNPYDYRVPLEGEDLEIDQVLQNGTRFKLVGWVRMPEIHSEGIDQHDPLRYSLSCKLALPGTAITQWAKLKMSHDQTRSYSENCPDLVVSIFEHWDDCSGHPHDNSFQTDGHRLWINQNQFRAFLKAKKMDLLIKCTISRRNDRNSTKEERHVPQAKLYLVHEDGSIETARGYFGSREENNPRTEAG